MYRTNMLPVCYKSIRSSVQVDPRQHVPPNTCSSRKHTKEVAMCVRSFGQRTHKERTTATSSQTASSIFHIIKTNFPNQRKTFPVPSFKTPSNHVTRQQKVRNPLLDRILVLAAATHQLATLYARLHQQCVQILESLRRLVVVRHQNFGFGRLFW